MSMFERAGAMLRNALAELDAKVKMVRDLGYPMPWGNTSRTVTEIDLLAVAATVLEAEDKLRRVTNGERVTVLKGLTATDTDADYWRQQCEMRRRELVEATAHALNTRRDDEQTAP